MKSNNHANIVSVFVVPHTTYARSNFIFDGKIVMSLLNDFFVFRYFPNFSFLQPIVVLIYISSYQQGDSVHKMYEIVAD